jgi:hypothetical protein
MSIRRHKEQELWDQLEPLPNRLRVASRHVEGKGAIWIRENGSSGGVVFHNNTDGTCGLCDAQLERLLPSKSVLDVLPPPDAVPKDAKAVAAPSWYVGDDILPKAPAPIQQPDFFREWP